MSKVAQSLVQVTPQASVTTVPDVVLHHSIGDDVAGEVGDLLQQLSQEVHLGLDLRLGAVQDKLHDPVSHGKMIRNNIERRKRLLIIANTQELHHALQHADVVSLELFEVRSEVVSVPGVLDTSELVTKRN